MPAVDRDRLRKLQPFVGLSEDELEAVARVAEEYEEPAGTTLVREGDYGYELIAIEEGTAEVVRDGAVVDEIGPGDFFGEIAVMEKGGLRNASVVATSPVRIIAITQHHMRVLGEQLPAVAEKMRHAGAERGGAERGG
jgi:CRP-like cAMP-binding protein